MIKRIFLDRRKYRLIATVITIIMGIVIGSIWFIGGNLFQLPSDSMLIMQLITVIVAAIIFFVFKRWTKSEDERVLLLSQKAARKTVYFAVVALVAFSMFFTWVSNKYFENDYGAEPFQIVFINHTNITLPIQNSSAIIVINSNTSHSSGFEIASYPKALVFEIEPTILNLQYPRTDENLTVGLFYSDVSYTLLFVAGGLWVNYLIFCYYYGRKFGEF